MNLDERLLGDVFSIAVVLRDAECGAIYEVLIIPDKSREGF